MKVTFPLTFINIHLTCVSHSSSLPNNMCNWPYGWKFDNKIWTHGWQWQSSTLLNFIYMVNNIHIVNLFRGHNFIHVVASLLIRFTLSYFYHGLRLIYVIRFVPWPLSHLCYHISTMAFVSSIYVINFIHTCHVASLCYHFIHVMKFNHMFWLYPCGSIFIQVVILHSCIHYKHIIPHQFHLCKNIIPYQFHPCHFYHIQYYPLYSPHFIHPLGIIHVYYGIVLIFKILQINNVAL
jgi:hypothetical protein